MTREQQRRRFVSQLHRACKLKIAGLTYAEIGKRLRVSRQRAHQLVRAKPPVSKSINKAIVLYLRKRNRNVAESKRRRGKVVNREGRYVRIRLEDGTVVDVQLTEDSGPVVGGKIKIKFDPLSGALVVGGEVNLYYYPDPE